MKVKNGSASRLKRWLRDGIDSKFPLRSSYKRTKLMHWLHLYHEPLKEQTLKAKRNLLGLSLICFLFSLEKLQVENTTLGGIGVKIESQTLISVLFLTGVYFLVAYLVELFSEYTERKISHYRVVMGTYWSKEIVSGENHHLRRTAINNLISNLIDNKNPNLEIKGFITSTVKSLKEMNYLENLIESELTRLVKENGSEESVEHYEIENKILITQQYIWVKLFFTQIVPVSFCIFSICNLYPKVNLMSLISSL